MTALLIDSEFKSLIPPLADEELRRLEESLQVEGCRDALLTWQGILIDGHNRYEICRRLGIDYRVVECDFTDRESVLLWMIDNQCGRRNLADIDRIALAAKRESIIRRKAEASYKENVGRPAKSSAKLPTISKVNTRKESAKAAGVGERTYDAGKLVLDAAASGAIKPEVVEDIRRGRAAIHRVAKEIKERTQYETRQNRRLEAAASAPPMDDRIIVGDFREHAHKVADGSLSLIFTDPPYDKNGTALLPDLAKFAAAKLADGGSLIFYIGHTKLIEAIDAMRDCLRYYWTIACVHSGRSTVMNEYGINAGWKPVLWFVKGSCEPHAFVKDVMSGATEKSYHDWQQSQSEAEYWIEKLCPPDGIVCDPFVGGGTTPAAAQKLGRQWIRFEIVESQARIAGSRLAA